LRPGGAQVGRFLRLRVADDGCGMDESIQQRLFTPFFTCKGAGRGLGLATLIEIARAHRGGVRVFSEPQRGTIFDVFLPLADMPAGPSAGESGTPAATPPSAARARRLSGHVLIADDEDVLRQSLAQYLTTQGATVHAVADGEAALQQLDATPEIDLLLLDLVMPKVGGLEVLMALRSAGRQTPVILMSGNVEPEINEQLATFAPAVMLAKPFSLAELTELMAEHLPAPSAG
jgi:CheY-like chemotaxis protein